ncbi:MAG TPA: hypothetical protein DCF44_07220, partial [Chitinophagaceae bacterium]|nr:hypothetical protein [Chitinophagaceae bacterium]
GINYFHVKQQGLSGKLLLFLFSTFCLKTIGGSQKFKAIALRAKKYQELIIHPLALSHTYM